MVSAKQKPTTKYAVTLAVEGSKLETVAKKIKGAVGDVKVLSVEKVVIPGSGEWATEWVKHVKYTNPVLVNTDGRVIQRFEEYDDNDQPIEGKYAYYYTRDAYGKQIANADGKYHIESLEEAKSLVREPMTQDEITSAADWVAAHVVRFGAVDRDEDAGKIEDAARSYLMARGMEVPEENNGEDEGNRRTPRFIVTLTVKASTLPTVEKRAKKAFGDKLVRVEKVKHGFTRAEDLARAERKVEEATEIVHELKDDMESWRDNLPENFQGGSKEEELETAASSLEEIENALDSISWDVEFPGAF